MSLYELREALTALRMRPFFVLSIVCTLAVTLGILLCMVNLNQVLLVRSLPYPHADRLVVGVGNVYDGNDLKYPGMVAYPMAEHLEKHADVAALAILNFGQDIVTSLPQRPKLRLTNVTPRYFDMLGASFARGRGLAAENGIGAKEPVAVVSYAAWQKYFAGSDDVLNEKVVINDVAFRVIGVTARDFIEPELYQAGLSTDIWLPWELNTWGEDMRKTWVSFTDQIKIVALLKPGQGRSQAQQMLESLIADRFEAQTRGSAFLRHGAFKFEVTPLKSYLVEGGRVAALLFLASSLALAIIACINVFNLLLSRAAEQQRQLAIRATLGANKRQIFRQVLAEHLLLIGVSMVFALILAAAVTYGMKDAIQGQLPRMAELSLSPLTVLIAFLLMLALAITFAAIVSHTIQYRRLTSLLNSSGKGSGLQVKSTVRQSLIVSQIAMAAFLLVAIASVLKVSYATVSRPPGFHVDNVMFGIVSIGSLQLNREELIRYTDEIKEKLLQLPQVTKVSSAGFVPMISNRWTTEVKLDPAGTDSFSAASNLIDEDYLAVMGQEIVSGSNFSPQDVRSSARKVLVNETLARKIAPSGDAVGKRIYWLGEDQVQKAYEVLGVVRDVAIPRMPHMSMLFGTRLAEPRFIVEVRPGQELSREQFQNVLTEVNRSFNLFEYETVRSLYDGLVLKDLFIIWVAIGLGALAVMLASIGIYGVLNYGIRLRRYELGVRMSIGAGPRRILGLIYQENLKLLLTGALAGMIILLICDRVLAEAADYELPLTLGTGVLGYGVIIVSVAAACYLPLHAIITRWPVFALRGNLG